MYTTTMITPMTSMNNSCRVLEDALAAGEELLYRAKEVHCCHEALLASGIAVGENWAPRGPLITEVREGGASAQPTGEGLGARRAQLAAVQLQRGEPRQPPAA